MSKPEAAQFSYVRATREVSNQSPSLDEFLARAETIGEEIFGLKEQYWVDLPGRQDSGGRGKVMGRRRGAVVGNANIKKSSELRVTLFERRAPADDDANNIFSRVHRRMVIPVGPGGRPNLLQSELRAIQNAQTCASPDLLSTIATSIIDSTNTGYVPNTTEYSFVIDPDSDAGQVIQEQAAHVYKALRATKAGALLLRGSFQTEGNVLHVPFAHIPNGSPEDHELFVDFLNDDCDVELGLDQPEWDSKSRAVKAANTVTS